MQRKNEKNCGNSEGVAQAFAERLGRRVRQLRISLELSQTELGQILGGFGMATISELERAKLKRMGLGMLARLLALCLERKISLEWLFAGIGAMEAVQPDLSDASREQLMRALAGQFADELLTRSRLRVAPAEAAEPLRAGDNVEPLPGPLQVVRLVEPGFRVTRTGGGGSSRCWAAWRRARAWTQSRPNRARRAGRTHSFCTRMRPRRPLPSAWSAIRCCPITATATWSWSIPAGR